MTDIQTTHTRRRLFATVGDAPDTVAISAVAFTYDGERAVRTRRTEFPGP